jgi:NADH:ubiquinone oxidoreductase subunit 2 (subunit N)
MNLPDIIGLIIIVSILLLRVLFKVDTRWLIIASIVALLVSAGFLVAMSTPEANVAGTVAFYCLAAEVVLILLSKIGQRIRGNDEEKNEKVSLYGNIPDLLKRIKDRRGR